MKILGVDYCIKGDNLTSYIVMVICLRCGRGLPLALSGTKTMKRIKKAAKEWAEEHDCPDLTRKEEL